MGTALLAAVFHFCGGKLLAAALFDDAVIRLWRQSFAGGSLWRQWRWQQHVLENGGTWLREAVVVGGHKSCSMWQVVAQCCSQAPIDFLNAATRNTALFIALCHHIF